MDILIASSHKNRQPIINKSRYSLLQHHLLVAAHGTHNALHSHPQCTAQCTAGGHSGDWNLSSLKNETILGFVCWCLLAQSSCIGAVSGVRRQWWGIGERISNVSSNMSRKRQLASQPWHVQQSDCMAGCPFGLLVIVTLSQTHNCYMVALLPLLAQIMRTVSNKTPPLSQDNRVVFSKQSKIMHFPYRVS